MGFIPRKGDKMLEQIQELLEAEFQTKNEQIINENELLKIQVVSLKNELQKIKTENDQYSNQIKRAEMF